MPSEPWTPAREAAALARCEAATAGPWRDDVMSSTSIWIRADNVGQEMNWPVSHIGANHPDSIQRPNAQFIAHARQDLPALLAEVARLRDQLDSLKILLMLLAGENYTHDALRELIAEALDVPDE